MCRVLSAFYFSWLDSVVVRSKIQREREGREKKERNIYLRKIKVGKERESGRRKKIQSEDKMAVCMTGWNVKRTSSLCCLHTLGLYCSFIDSRSPSRTATNKQHDSMAETTTTDKMRIPFNSIAASEHRRLSVKSDQNRPLGWPVSVIFSRQVLTRIGTCQTVA